MIEEVTYCQLLAVTCQNKNKYVNRKFPRENLVPLELHPQAKEHRLDT